MSNTVVLLTGGLRMQSGEHAYQLHTYRKKVRNRSIPQRCQKTATGGSRADVMIISKICAGVWIFLCNRCIQKRAVMMIQIKSASAVSIQMPLSAAIMVISKTPRIL